MKVLTRLELSVNYLEARQVRSRAGLSNFQKVCLSIVRLTDKFEATFHLILLEFRAVCGNFVSSEREYVFSAGFFCLKVNLL